MVPYYESWQKSSHNQVACVKCHFPPGFGGEVRGKLMGLVQVIKYFTNSAGPKPTAEIPDESCLRSGCHETRLLSGQVDFHGTDCVMGADGTVVPIDVNKTPFWGEAGPRPGVLEHLRRGLEHLQAGATAW